MEEEYTTLDIYLSAFLTINGLTPKLKRPNSEKIVFAFPKTPQLQELINRYYQDERVDVFSYVRTIKELRAEMHDLRGGKRREHR